MEGHSASLCRLHGKEKPEREESAVQVHRKAKQAANIRSIYAAGKEKEREIQRAAEREE